MRDIKIIDLAREGTLLPPPPGKCQLCAVDHPPEAPHNQDSMYWQFGFYKKNGRWPTWADAIAHCSDDIKAATISVLKEHGAWEDDKSAAVSHTE